MKRICIFIFVFVIAQLNAQNIKGIVVDENNKPLYGANVYLDGSSVATATDQNGNFVLPLKSKTELRLVVSFVGFQTQYFNNYDAAVKLKIILKAELNDLNEVVIRKSKFTRKQLLRAFKEQFLGVTEAAKKTIIENEDAINLYYNDKEFRLEASSEVPLLIKNNYFGYKIYYQIVDFEVKYALLSIDSKNVTKSFYSGLSRFEVLSSDLKILKRRARSYQGSLVYFFRSLSQNTLANNKFVLFDGSFSTDSKYCFKISDTLDLKKIIVIKNIKGFRPKNFVAEYSVLFNKKEQSKITFHTDTFFVDSSGNYSNLDSIMFSGSFADKRVANLLPLDYGL